MGTLPIIQKLIGLLVGSSTRLPAFVLLIVITLGVEVSEIRCSGGVHLDRPYLFRDFGMPAGQAPPAAKAHAQFANLYHLSQMKKSSPNQHQRRVSSSQSTESSSEYFDDGGSSEEEPGLEYTAPLILDIDDPEVRARWMGFSSFEQDEYNDFDDDDGDDGGGDGEGERSISSTEFQSRSGVSSSSTSEDESSSGSQQDKSNEKTSSRRSDAEDGDKRGIMDYLPSINFWGGEDDGAGQSQGQQQQGELPQDDLEMPFYDYQQYIYQPYGSYDYEQFYSPQVTEPQHDQPKPPMKMMKPKSKPKPKPKPKPKQPKPKSKPKRKPKPKPNMPPPRPMKVIRRRKKPPQYSHFHYQVELEKTDKLSLVKEKLAKLNPFRYVQIQKPQIKIQKPPEGPPSGWPGPPPMKRPKQPPPMPMKMKRPKHPPMMKMKPKGPKPKPQKMKPKQKKPMSDEDNSEFVMYFGQPFQDFSSGEVKVMDGQHNQGGGYGQEDDQGEAQDDDDDDDDDDEEGDEEDEYEEDDEYGYENYAPYGGSEAEEADEGTLSDDETLIVEDDEADYSSVSYSGVEDNGDNRANENGGQTEQVQEDQPEANEDGKEKSISLTKYIGLRKRKKHRRHPPKRVPARRPPHWKQYRPAPLLPEFPEKLSDALLTVVKNVGFLPEYGKDEKYGGHGHNKIKGKFTKTRPITLHHGLLTEVLRRK